MKKILFIVFALFYTCSFATTVTVKNTGGNVNAGGTYVGGVAPGTTDTVICDGTSGQLTINTTTTVGKINFSGYTGTLTMTAALTVAGDITLGASMIISGSSALTCSATGNPYLECEDMAERFDAFRYFNDPNPVRQMDKYGTCYVLRRNSRND
jgi:hypothetical protein